MIIRDETPGDIDAIWHVIRDAFQSEVEADLANSLRANGDTVLSLLAEDAGDFVGHVMLSKIHAPDRCLCVSPVSVLTKRRGQKVGSRLMQECVARAARDGWQALFLLGNPASYERFGFSATTADKFETTYTKRNFMAIELVPGALRGRSGPYIEPQPFQDLA